VRVAIIGMGTVGHAMAELFEGRAELVTYDIATTREYPKVELAECDFAVVCVNTPEMPDGSCDTTRVEEAVATLPLDRVLLRSTVSPGTTDRMARATGKRICFAPEYVGESPYEDAPWKKAADVPFLIVGGRPADRRWIIDRMVGILGPTYVYYQCSAVEAEVIKYMENAFLATKVAFVNEFYRICEVVGADWHTVREGWLLDRRVGKSHSAVFPDHLGFDGKCLPKDLHAIVAASAAAGYRPELLVEVTRSNTRHRGARLAGRPSES
jgi:UDPglucose 6-dehydrogenase